MGDNSYFYNRPGGLMKATMIAAALCGLLLAGCGYGSNFEFDRARQVKVGMTEAELTTLMGKPFSVTSRGDTQVWVWTYFNAMTGASQTITFGMKEGTVSFVPAIPASFK
jgi:outer membrane protein assembly factor BamE (lipoprotein component of BamABCDE complex)